MILTELDHRRRFVIRQLEAYLPAIENALQAGHQHKEIHKRLEEQGLVLGFFYYKKSLSILRKERSKKVKSDVRNLVSLDMVQNRLALAQASNSMVSNVGLAPDGTKKFLWNAKTVEIDLFSEEE